jgi:hypothetical protein
MGYTLYAEQSLKAKSCIEEELAGIERTINPAWRINLDPAWTELMPGID